MENLKLHFWDSLTSHSERTAFRQALTTSGIRTSTDTADLTDINLLFIHGADSAGLNNYTFQSHVFKVSFGDNATDLKPIFIEENRISYINADELSSRFQNIHEELQTIPELTIERLYEIVFGFDKSLEDYLEPFGVASAYEITNKQGKVLKDAKAELQAYVGEYLQKQSKP